MLRYGLSSSGLNPYAVVALGKSPMLPQQEYDLSVKLSMPRSPPNTDRGNFMVAIHLLDGTTNDELLQSARNFADNHDTFGAHRCLYDSRRSALLPYVDPIVALASRTLLLFYHMLFRSSQNYYLTLSLAEQVFFPRGAAVPSSAYIEVEAGQTIQVYSMELAITAQLRGLRWLMFHYRLPTYMAFTMMFWMCEILSMCVAWAIWSVCKSPSSEDAIVKSRATEKTGYGRLDPQDEEELDRPHQFPTYGRQPPLKHEPDVKVEGDNERLIAELPFGGAEADDEDDESEEGYNRMYRDSGIGTSFSDEGQSSVRRRSSRSSKK